MDINVTTTLCVSIKSTKGRLSVKDGLLYSKHKLFIRNIPLRNENLRNFHEIASAGHLGERKTRHKLSRLYYWKSLRKDVAEYVRSRPLCQKTKSHNSKPFGLLQPIDPPDSRWSVITMAFIGPLPETNKCNKHVLNVVDKLFKNTQGYTSS